MEEYWSSFQKTRKETIHKGNYVTLSESENSQIYVLRFQPKLYSHKDYSILHSYSEIGEGLKKVLADKTPCFGMKHNDLYIYYEYPTVEVTYKEGLTEEVVKAILSIADGFCSHNDCVTVSDWDEKLL